MEPWGTAIEMTFLSTAPAAGFSPSTLAGNAIGMALSDPLGITAQGLDTLQRTNIRADLAELSRIIAERGVSLVLMGNPLHLSGQESRQTGYTPGICRPRCSRPPAFRWSFATSG